MRNNKPLAHGLFQVKETRKNPLGAGEVRITQRDTVFRTVLGLCLNGIKVVKMDELINEKAGFLNGCRFFNTNTFTNAEEVFSHGIVPKGHAIVRIGPSCPRGRNAVL